MSSPTPLPKDSLLACPFCGWEAEHRTNEAVPSWPHYVKCVNCWAQSDNGPTIEAVTVRWNMRVPARSGS